MNKIKSLAFFIFLSKIAFCQVAQTDSLPFYRMVTNGFSGNLVYIQFMTGNKLLANYGYYDSCGINYVEHFIYDSLGKCYEIREWYSGKLSIMKADTGYPFLIQNYDDPIYDLTYDKSGNVVESKLYHFVTEKKHVFFIFNKSTRVKKVAEWYKFYYCRICTIKDEYW